MSSLLKWRFFTDKMGTDIDGKGAAGRLQARLARGLGSRGRTQGIVYSKCQSHGIEEMAELVLQCRFVHDIFRSNELLNHSYLRWTLLHIPQEDFWDTWRHGTPIVQAAKIQ